MYETKQQVTQRKIRNGLRKQAEAIQREKEKVWDILKEDPNKRTGWPAIDNDVNSYYMSAYVPVMGDSVINWETTA